MTTNFWFCATCHATRSGLLQLVPKVCPVCKTEMQPAPRPLPYERKVLLDDDTMRRYSS